MQFRRITATFGKLDRRALTFEKGLNIIEAPNESGKSTLLAFLRVMLYGFPARERGAFADKNRYAPWSLAPMQGTLELICRAGDLTLTRDTLRAGDPMGRFSAVYTGSGESAPSLTAEDAGEQLLGVPRAFNASFAEPDEFSKRIARNVELLLKHESHFDQVVDPAGGNSPSSHSKSSSTRASIISPAASPRWRPRSSN